MADAPIHGDTAAPASETAASKVFSDVDFAGQGKQVTVLRVPNSNDLSGWGTISVPIVVVANGTGPTVLMTGAMHGDEYEGQITLMKLARRLQPEDVQGRVIMIPALHFPAAMAGRRMSPLDGRDLNRCFPGAANGTFADVLAHYVTSVVLPHVDVLFDIHSGGRGLNIAPSTTCHHHADPERMARVTALAKAAAAPTHMFLRSVDETRTLSAVAAKRGILTIASEFGGAGIVQRTALAVAERAAHNILVHTGVLRAAPLPAPGPTRLVEIPTLDAFTFAPSPGVFEPADALGATVEKGAHAGAVHFIETPDRAPADVAYGATGMLWCTRGAGRVETGDPVAIVAVDWKG